MPDHVRAGLTASDLARQIADYMATRAVPWRDEGVMREAVHEAIRLAIGEAHHDTREALKVTHGY